MIVRKCPICKKLVWFWQDRAKVNIELKTGKTLKVFLHLDCFLGSYHNWEVIYRNAETRRGGSEMKKIYIAGKITGDPDYRAKFRAEDERLRALGYDTVNPAELVPEGTPWDMAMRTVIKAMLDCDGVSLLPGWRNSRGAVIEECLARLLKMDVREIAGWDGR